MYVAISYYPVNVGAYAKPLGITHVLVTCFPPNHHDVKSRRVQDREIVLTVRIQLTYASVEIRIVTVDRCTIVKDRKVEPEATSKAWLLVF